MSNAFWNFVNRLVPGTKAKAAEINAQFDGVTVGFDGVEAAINAAASQSANAATAASAASTAAAAASAAAASAQTTANAALPRSGGTMGGMIVLAGSATASLHPVSKVQMDAELALKADKASPIFTGNVTVPTPSLPTDASNKAYTDAADLALSTAITAQIATRAPLTDAGLLGAPTAPTPPANDNTERIANTTWVLSKIAASVAGVASFNGRTGVVSLSSADVTNALSYTPVNRAGGQFYADLDYVSAVVGGVAVLVMPNSDLSQWIGRRRRADNGLIGGGILTDDNSITLRQYSSDNTVAYDLKITSTGTLTYNGTQVWTATSLTSLSQLSNSVTQYISASGAPVQSVFGRAGNVVMALTDITGTLGYTPIQQGTGVGQTSNAIKIGWSAGSKLKATVDSTDLGNIALESWVLAQGFLTGITSGQITAALGYTPYSAANPASYITASAAAAAYASKGGDTFSGDITTYRSFAPTTGVLFLGNSGARYLFYNGSNYEMPGAPLYVGGKIYGNSSGMGLGAVTVSTGTPAGGVDGDLWLRY